jgi:CRISPR-associated protein Cas1
VRAAAAIAVMATAAIPQLGFVHEDSSQAFILDIADLYRDSTTLQIAFGAVRDSATLDLSLERLVRRRANQLFAETDLIPAMIERIKQMMAPP